MKIRNLASITALAFALCSCSRSAPEYASPKSIKSQFPDQFSRVEYYAENFTKLIHAVPYPPEGTDEMDKRLFGVPSILDVSIFNESTSIGMGRDSWSREPLKSRSFWMALDTDKLPRVAIGKGRAAAGKEFDIVEYSDVVIEPATGNKIRITINFDLAELKKHAEQASGGNGGEAR